MSLSVSELKYFELERLEEMSDTLAPILLTHKELSLPLSWIALFEFCGAVMFFHFSGFKDFYLEYQYKRNFKIQKEGFKSGFFTLES